MFTKVCMCMSMCVREREGYACKCGGLGPLETNATTVILNLYFLLMRNSLANIPNNNCSSDWLMLPLASGLLPIPVLAYFSNIEMLSCHSYCHLQWNHLWMNGITFMRASEGTFVLKHMKATIHDQLIPLTNEWSVMPTADKMQKGIALEKASLENRSPALKLSNEIT